MRKLAATLTVALFAALVPTASGARTADCDTITVRTWNVKVDVPQKSYGFGETIKVDLLVTQKKTHNPVSGALAAILLTNRKDHAVIASSETDAAGMATVEGDLARRELARGNVKLFAFAYRRTVDSPCASVGEYGYKKVPRAFRIK